MKTVLFLCLVLSVTSSLRSAESKFAAEKKEDRLIITHGGKPLADFVFKDTQILRPYFSNVNTLTGVAVTRSHPPVEGAEGSDHSACIPAPGWRSEM